MEHKDGTIPNFITRIISPLSEINSKCASVHQLHQLRCWCLKDLFLQTLGITKGLSKWKNELKAKSTLMLAIPDEHLLKFHACKDAKSLWEAIKNRIGGNKESKKMPHTIPRRINNTMLPHEPASTTSYVDDVMFSFFPNQSNAPQLTMKIGGYDWSFQAEEGLTNFALMAFTSQRSSSSDSKVHTCSKDCLKSYEALQKQYDQQREALNKSNLEIIVKDISIKDLKNQLEEALKEKDDLKLKLEKFEESSKNLTKLINSQISAKDKTGLGYDSQINESELNNIHKNESEVIHSVFNSRESDAHDNPVNDRFKTGEGFHAVPPLYIGNYMPPRPDLSFVGLDESVFKSVVRKTTISMLETETSISKTSKDIIEKPKTVRPRSTYH
ncbi:hypothetical protein Tco_0637648 [Tanacetum coccineum]